MFVLVDLGSNLFPAVGAGAHFVLGDLQSQHLGDLHHVDLSDLEDPPRHLPAGRRGGWFDDRLYLWRLRAESGGLQHCHLRVSGRGLLSLPRSYYMCGLFGWRPDTRRPRGLRGPRERRPAVLVSRWIRGVDALCHWTSLRRAGRPRSQPLWYLRRRRSFRVQELRVRAKIAQRIESAGVSGRPLQPC